MDVNLGSTSYGLREIHVRHSVKVGGAYVFYTTLMSARPRNVFFLSHTTNCVIFSSIIIIIHVYFIPQSIEH